MNTKVYGLENADKQNEPSQFAEWEHGMQKNDKTFIQKM